MPVTSLTCRHMWQKTTSDDPGPCRGFFNSHKILPLLRSLAATELVPYGNIRFETKHYSINSKNNWCSNCIFCCNLFNSWISGHSDIWIHAFGYLDIWISGCLDIWISGYLDIWIFGYLDIWISGYLDIWIFGYVDSGKNNLLMHPHSEILCGAAPAVFFVVQEKTGPWCFAT